MLYLGKSRIDLATFSLIILNHNNATYLAVSYLENKSLCFSGKVRAMKHFAGNLEIENIQSNKLCFTTCFSVHKPLVLALL